MIGGDKDVVERRRAALRVHGQNDRPPRPAGAGQHTKMVNQILIASNMVGVCEALLYGYKAGLDLGNGASNRSPSGAAGSKSLEVLGPRILARNFEPGFYVEHFIKDMGIALDESKTHGPRHAGPGPGQPALPGGAGAGLWPQGHASPDARARTY